MTDRQFDVLIGMSRNMEKSLAGIEKALSAGAKAGEEGGSALGSLSQSLGSLLAAVSSKKFDAKKAENILDFSKNLVNISNSVKTDSAKAFADFAAGISGTFDTLIEVMSPMNMLKLYLATKILFEGKNPILKRIAIGMSEAFKDLDGKKAKEGGEAIKNLGEGLLSLTKAMKGFILIGLMAPLVLAGALVVRGVIALFSTFGKNAKEIEEGGKALKDLGKGLVAFSIGLATVLLVTLVAGTNVIEAIGLIALFGLTFWALGKAEKAISEGAKAVALMGLALFGFSAALASFMLVMLIVQPAGIILGIGILAMFGLAFWALGQFKPEIIAGAEAMLGMAIGLFFFSLALMVFAGAMKLLKGEDLLMGAMVITEMGLATYLLGRYKKPILDGSEALAEIGLGLIIFSGGILAFGVAIKLLSMLFSGELVQAGVIAGSILLGLGYAVSIIGELPGVKSGATAMAEIGGALIIVSAGILLFGVAIKLLQMIFKDGLAQAGMIAGGILLGLGLAFSIIGGEAAFITPGAGAMIAVGVALVAVSVGILVFALAIKALQSMFDDLGKAGMIAGGILLGLGLAFAGIGVLSVPIVLGSVAVLTMGISLLAFSVGLLVFGGALAFLDSKGLLVKDGDEYSLKGSSVLWNLSKVIAGIGIQALNPFFWLGMATAVGLGASLLTIGLGLVVAAEALDKVKDMNKLVDGIFGDTGLIPTMAESFSKIGKKYGGGLLSSFLGTDDVSVGVRVAGSFGNVLKDIAGGIVAFADFTQFPVKVPDPKDPSRLIYKSVDMFGEIIPKLNENLPTLLSTLATTFADIGAKYGGEGGWFGEDSPVQKGISAVKGMGTILSELAGGIIAFANFSEFPIQVPDPKDPSKLIYKVVDLMDAIPKIKTALIGDGSIQGKVTAKTGILFGLAEVFAEIGTKFGDGFFTDGPVKKGVDAVQGIGGVISELATGILAFASMERGLPNYDKDGKFNGTYTKFKLEDVRNNISKVLKTLPQVFATVDLKEFEAAKEKADAARPLAESIAKIGKALNELMVDKGKGEKVNLAAMIGPVLKQFVQDTNGINIDEKKTQQLVKLGQALSSFSKIGGGLSEFAKALSATGRSFEVFAKGFSTFSTQLDKFVRFENAFSNLAKNQYQYKFGEFSKSMGVLKENVNAFNVENLKLTDSLMKSLAILSKSPDALGETIKESLEESMKQLIEAIQKLTESQQASNTAIAPQPTAAENFMNSAKTPAAVGKPAPKPEARNNQAGNASMVAAINEVKNAIDELKRKFQFADGGALKVTK